ncbi:MAG: sulfite reductase flavoprotein subunit alpha [Verrucomicrobiales bacterium]
MQLPDSAPFSAAQRQALANALAGLSPLQTGWLSGWLAGSGSSALSSKAPAAKPKVTLLYGSESGNSEQLGDGDVKKLKAAGFDATLLNMADAKVSALATMSNLLVIVSTWGDGEPPDTSTTFYNELLATSGLDLSGTSFSVCALGDTSYEKFCQCGKEVDRKLAELGATRLTERADCDVDYEATHAEWFGRVLAALKAAVPAASETTAVSEAAIPAIAYGKKHPFPSPLKRKFLLNGPGSAKETWHLEFDLEGSGMGYEPGDALAIVPKNAPDVVEAILAAGKFSANTRISLKDDETYTLADALTGHLDITGLTSVVLGKYQTIAQSEKIARLLDPENKKELIDWLHGRQIVDLLEEFPCSGLDAQAFCGLLRKLPPRLYSIASSLKAHPGEVHLTVAAVRYETHGRLRKGVASTFVADLLDQSHTASVYTHANKNFKLPSSGDTPVIMVGPGTGIAPYRAFVEERAANGDGGKSWLFFGDQHYTYDFLYQLEWQDHLKSGALTRLDVAFSRDQKEKIYVQHRMLERARELWAWLEEGAHFYVCGDASRMAQDVHETLIQIVINEGGLDHDAAIARVEEWKKTKRYQRDVY